MGNFLKVNSSLSLISLEFAGTLTYIKYLSFIGTGTRIDFFCEAGSSSSLQKGRLQTTVRNGRRMSMNSFNMYFWTGSRLKIFSPDVRLVRRISSVVTGLKMVVPQVVGGKTGDGQPSVASSMERILILRASGKASAWRAAQTARSRAGVT